MTTKNSSSELLGACLVKSMHEHLEVGASAVDELPLFFKSAFKQDWGKTEAIYNNVHSIIGNANSLKKNIDLHLTQHHLFLPIPRNDVLGLLAAQQFIADTAKDIAHIVLGRKMVIPDDLQAPLLALVVTVVDNVHLALRAIEAFEALFESGVYKDQGEWLGNYVSELHVMQNQANTQKDTLLNTLFGLEHALKDSDVMFFYRIITYLVDLVTQAQTVGSTIQQLLIR